MAALAEFRVRQGRGDVRTRYLLACVGVLGVRAGNRYL